MLGDVSGLEKIYIVCGYTDMRKSIDGLSTVIEDQLKMDPSSSALFLFCGRRRDRIKALFREPDGFVLIYKRLSVRGGYQWPRKQSEVRNLSWREFDWLMSGIDIDQPKPQSRIKSSWILAEILHRKIRKSLVNSAFFQALFSFSKSPLSGIIKESNPRRETMASSAKDIQLRELKDTVSQLKTMIAEQTELIKALRLIIDEKTSHEKALQEQVDYLTKKTLWSLQREKI
mgnify:CR=1 FL=1